MSEYVPEGALLPSGINVDETAAYFGITDSSQILLELENSNRHSCITIVLNKISDLLLTDTFDLDSGSNRLKVESGEIYYILTGPLELLKVTENLQIFLGLNPNEGSVEPNITEEQFSALELLLDPMNVLKIYAIGDVTGGNNELAKYVTAFDNMIANPSENIQDLIQISKELAEILIETKNMQMPRAISILKSAKAVQAPKLITPQPTIQEEVKEEVKEEIKSNPINVIPPQDEVQETISSTTNLQEPMALKPPMKKTNIIEPTPLVKPEILQKPVNIPKEEPRSMKDLEKESLDTNNWISEKSEYNQTSESINQIKPTPKIVPVIPKSKPINSNVIPTPKIQPIEEPTLVKKSIPTRSYNSQSNFNSDIQSPNLPKPKKRSLPEPINNINTNGIIRTFPNGNICKGCGVSLSNSWRFCPLCGFNN